MKHLLQLDSSKETDRIAHFIKDQVFNRFKYRGAVIGLSGGIDSALVSALCVRALGKENCQGLILPEKESNPVSKAFALKHAEALGIRTEIIDITRHLEGMNVYQDRNAVIKKLFPEFDDTCTFQVTLPQNLLEKDRLNFHTLSIKSPDNQVKSKRLSSAEWLAISSCQNVKLRVRMIYLYRYAEKNNYLVAGTTNKSEVMQGFFVKHGDGAVDIETIAHLYKTQVYQLARHLGVIEEIISRPPSPDTYSWPVTDEQFYFCMPYDLADLLLYAHENHTPEKEVCEATKLTSEQVQRVFRDFKAKENSTWHLRQMPPTVEG